MSRLVVLAALGLWAGLTLLLAELRWFRRVGITQRLQPYAPPQARSAPRSGALSVDSFREVMGPLVASATERVLTVLGVNESLAITLQRLHAPLDTTAFRLREAGWAGGALAAATVACLVVSPPAPLVLLFLTGAPLLAVLLIEQQLAGASTRRQTRLFEELPVTLEQLGMLLGAGYSLGSALNRLAERGSGVIAEDLRRVANRIRQGLSEGEALGEWAAVSGVPEVRRLVDILALNRHGADLGHLVAEEARSVRREAHRRTLEIIERRAQLVWVPVTIATLVPGVLFMAIPFIEAMRNFAAL